MYDSFFDFLVSLGAHAGKEQAGFSGSKILLPPWIFLSSPRLWKAKRITISFAFSLINIVLFAPSTPCPLIPTAPAMV